MTSSRNLPHWFSLALLVVLSPTALHTPSPIVASDTCTACFFQRNANLPYILRRAVHESGPDENQTFGHCFVCLRCDQPGNNDDPIPYCRGWWPADPEGGDYEGDEGIVKADQDETWDRVDCIAISPEEVLKLRTSIYGYGQDHDYQVVNQGGRSCLGYCSDIAVLLDFPTVTAWGDYTIPGDMRFPAAHYSTQRINDTLPDALTNQVWQSQTMTGN